MNDKPAAFVSLRIRQVHNSLLESISSKESDTSSIASARVAPIQLGDEVIS